MDNDANWELFVVVYVIQSVDILMFQEHHNSVHDYKFVSWDCILIILIRLHRSLLLLLFILIKFHLYFST